MGKLRAPAIGKTIYIYVNGSQYALVPQSNTDYVFENNANGNSGTYSISNGKVVWNDGTILQYNGVDVLPSDNIVGNRQYTTRSNSSSSSGETWLLNETYTEGGSGSYNINFTSNGETFGQFSYGDMPRWFIRYGETNAYFNGTWSNQAYRTITFANPPTGDLLTWLQNNGTKQTPTYKFKHWKKSNVVVNRTLVGEKYYYFKPYTILGLYTITTTLTNCTGASVNATKIQENGGLTLTFTANSGYELPTGVSVTNVTSYNWNKSTGVLAISKPTGDVAIEIVAVSALPQLSTPSNVAVTDTTLIFDEVANATSYEVFVDNVSIGTHTMPSVISLKWKFNGTKAFIPQRSYDNSFEIDYDVYNNDTLVESNLHYVYFNDNYTYMAFGSSGYWDTTNNKYGGGNIILFKTEPSGFLLQFLQEHCEALN